MCGLHQTSAVHAYGEVAWSRCPDAGIKLAVDEPPTTEANKPGTPGRSRISRDTIAQGMPDCFGVPVVTCLRAFFHCTQGCGCDKHPAFPAPSFLRGSEVHGITRTLFASRQGSRNVFQAVFADRGGVARLLRLIR